MKKQNMVRKNHTGLFLPFFCFQMSRRRKRGKKPKKREKYLEKRERDISQKERGLPPCPESSPECLLHFLLVSKQNSRKRVQSRTREGRRPPCTTFLSSSTSKKSAQQTKQTKHSFQDSSIHITHGPPARTSSPPSFRASSLVFKSCGRGIGEEVLLDKVRI